MRATPTRMRGMYRVRYTSAGWTSTTSRSTARSALASPHSQNGSRRGSTPRIVREDPENPFLADFYADRPGAALQAQLFYLLNRHRQLVDRRQADLFSQVAICDYIFEKDRIYAYLNLDDNELFIYQRLYDLLAQDVPTPDLVIYLQTPTDVLLKRLQARATGPRASVPAAGRGLSARAQRGVPSFLLSLHGDVSAGRRRLAVPAAGRR